MIRLGFLIAMLLMVHPGLHAQRFLQKFLTGQWIGDLYLIDKFDMSNPNPAFGKELLDDNNLRSALPGTETSFDFQVPTEYGSHARSMYWHNDALYAFASTLRPEANEDGSRFTRFNFVKWHDGEWSLLGDYKFALSSRRGAWLAVFPCDDDRFIAISGTNDLTGNNGSERTPFFKMSLPPGKNEIRLDSPIYHGMDSLKGQMSDQTIWTLITNSVFVKTDKHAVLVHPNLGLYWVFSLEKASLVRAGSIFSFDVTPELVAKLGYMDAILSIQPEKDGTVLISAQEEAAFKTELGNTFDAMTSILGENPGMSEQEAVKKLDDHMKAFARRNPNLVWYRIHPESGRLEKLASPPMGGAVRRVDEDGDNINDEWRPLSDGSVRMGPIVPSEPKKPAPETKQDDKIPEKLDLAASK
jgi:hypothetical protein